MKRMTVATGCITSPTVGVIGAASGRPTRRKAGMSYQGATEVGLDDTLQTLLKERDFETAKSMCEDNNIKYVQSSVEMPSTHLVDVDDQRVVQPQAEYSKQDSKFTHSGYCKLSGDFSDIELWGSILTWDLDFDDVRAPFDSAGPSDAASITFSDDRIRLRDWELGDRTKLEERGRHGVVGKFDDPNLEADIAPSVPDDSKMKGDMTVEYEKLEPNQECNIYGTYVHTWNTLGIPGSVSFSLAAGPVGVSVSGRTDYWKKRNDLSV